MDESRRWSDVGPACCFPWAAMTLGGAGDCVGPRAVPSAQLVHTPAHSSSSQAAFCRGPVALNRRTQEGKAVMQVREAQVNVHATSTSIF